MKDRTRWATVLGPPYVRLFTRERLLHTPALRSEPLGSGSWYLQLAPGPGEFRDPERHRAIESARKGIKAHLGDEAFAPPGATPVVPDEFRQIAQPAGSVIVFADGGCGDPDPDEDEP